MKRSKQEAHVSEDSDDVPIAKRISNKGIVKPKNKDIVKVKKELENLKDKKNTKVKTKEANPVIDLDNPTSKVIHPSILHRSQPSYFASILSNIKDEERKEAIRDAGFGDFLNLPPLDIPRYDIHWIPLVICFVGHMKYICNDIIPVFFSANLVTGWLVTMIRGWVH